MRRLVLDASAAVDLLLGVPRGRSVARHLVDAEVVAPALIDTEVLSALARLERGASITTASAASALAHWRAIPVERVVTTALAGQIWALRAAVRVTDAHYVALARLIEAPLITSDARLTRAVVPGVTFILPT